MEVPSPCGLNCEWCVYWKMDISIESSCPGCLQRNCPIRNCIEKEGHESCEACTSFPCYEFSQGYQCMRQHHIY
ncbi:MAG: hypothetical protein GKC03_09275 [Methanomassiliicoccales archaeon]|nr:hypothetical protein [Methanomassiliicoccales archaeon]NYT14614.1 hypothetical protein [Methanomassiliicoccales archaeon]